MQTLSTLGGIPYLEEGLTQMFNSYAKRVSNIWLSSQACAKCINWINLNQGDSNKYEVYLQLEIEDGDQGNSHSNICGRVILRRSIGKVKMKYVWIHIKYMHM